MGRDGRIEGAYVIGPSGERLTFADLPPADLKRWVSRRKAEVVLAVQGGLLTMDDACRRYGLTAEEYLSWEYGLSRYGLDGLKVGFAQTHRHAPRRAAAQATAQSARRAAQQRTVVAAFAH